MTILEAKGLTKRFGGLVAVSDIDFTLERGEIRGLIGPNGSGKTTIFNLITGFYRPTAGTIKFKGKDITKLSPQSICRLGIARTFQNVRPFLSMTVFQNVMVGSIFGHSGKTREDTSGKVAEILEFLGLYEKRDQRASSLTLADRRRLELARALATGPELLLLDEVAAGLNAVETEEVIEHVKKIRDRGITVFVIEHVMQAIMSLSDEVTVLSYGEKIAEGKPRDIANDRKVLDAYLGTESVA